MHHRWRLIAALFIAPPVVLIACEAGHEEKKAASVLEEGVSTKMEPEQAVHESMPSAKNACQAYVACLCAAAELLPKDGSGPASGRCEEAKRIVEDDYDDEGEARCEDLLGTYKLAVVPLLKMKGSPIPAACR